MFEEWHTMLESTVDVQNINAPKSAINSKVMMVLNRILENYNTSSLHTAQVKAEQVKDVMRENIDISLQNVEKLDDMDQKSADIEASSRQFHNYTRQVRWKMLMERWKAWIVVGSVAAILLIIIIIVLST
uniref:Synaptobrevin n=1 Tax=Lygus hesperus TaxID=30085 RepID=A0A0A9WDM0_LYGHE